MSKNVYYHEIVDTVIFQNPNRMDDANEAIEKQYGAESTVYTYCANAADVLSKVAESSNDDLLDWEGDILEEYAEEVADRLFAGDRLDNLDMIYIASSIGLDTR